MQTGRGAAGGRRLIETKTAGLHQVRHETALFISHCIENIDRRDPGAELCLLARVNARGRRLRP